MRLGTDCAVHRHVSRVPLEIHHVWPLGDGGPDIATNKIQVCANGHYEIHSCLDILRLGSLTLRQKLTYGSRVRHFAQLGIIGIRSRPTHGESA